jgi:hypothetical protein
MTSIGGSVPGSRFPYGKEVLQKQQEFTETSEDIPEDSSTRHLIFLIKKLTKRVEALETLLITEEFEDGDWRYVGE